VTLQSDGHAETTIHIDEFSIPPEYHGFLMAFLQGETPVVHGASTTYQIGNSQEITKLEVESDSGIFCASRGFISSSSYGQDTSITIAASDLAFAPREPVAADLWCLPLVGSLAEFQREGTASSIADRMPYLAFEDQGTQCGLVIIPKDRGVPFSAIAFGDIGNRGHATPDDAVTLLPSGMISALSFAAGSDITAPYLELRSRDGRLARRLHLRIGSAHHEDGSPCFSRFDCYELSSGLGEFLRRFFTFPENERDSLIPPMNLIRSGAPGTASIEENIAGMVTALDALCIRRRIGRRNLASLLNPANEGPVTKVLQRTREEMKQIRKDSKSRGESDQIAVIDKIVARLANAATDEDDFGLAVADLLRLHHLSDTEVMNAYYLQQTNTTWQGLLSTIRGQVIHTGAVHFRDRSQLLAWFDFAHHLHDVCTRVILKEVGYDGTYAASNAQCRGQYRVDRVTPSTPVSKLGYKKTPPSSI
jgi:hypothetical protein